MKNTLTVIGFVFLSLVGKTYAVYEDERIDRKHAHVLVKYIYFNQVRASFEDGQLGRESRVRMREEMLDDCPIAYRDANKRSLAQLLVWQEKRYLQGE